MAFETRQIELINAQQGHAAIKVLWHDLKPWLIAGHQLQIEVFDWHSRPQETLCHSCYRDLAAQCLLNEEKADAEDWKRVLLFAFWEATRNDPDLQADWKRRAPRMIKSLDGDGVVPVQIESKKFTKKLYAALISFVHSVGDDRGVQWSKTSLGRDAVPQETTP